ncbi:hypothetical protein EC991_005729 [Linnemannia zychae]|nr:hypothetical protein EC991_005729 [Linnemannia zychae]
MSAPSQQDRKRGGFLGLFRSSSSDAKVKSQGGAPKDAKQATTAGPDSSRLHRLSIVSTNAGIAHTITESTQSSVEIEHVVASTAIKDSAANVESSTLRTKPCLDVFQQNIDPPSVRVPLPEIHTRISATPQLALCMGLLPKNGSTIDQQEDLLQL